jgi:hypothetical protein
MDPDLFPRDRALLEPQTTKWLGDDILAVLARWIPLPALAAAGYVAGLLLLFAAAMWFMRGLGGSPWAVSAALTLLTLRHRIAKTGANSLEGYFHPRMLAFAIGVAALACVLRRRAVWAALLVLASLGVHTTTGLWFALVVGAGALYRLRAWTAGALAGTGLVVAIVLWMQSPRMDQAWLQVLADKDYLFAADWPLGAWVVNLTYLPVIAAIYAIRRRRGLVRDGERELVAGLCLLVAAFLVSVPLTSARVAIVVQLQVTRVFWVLDACAMLYLAWWLVDGIGRGHSRAVVAAFVASLVAASAIRGWYVTSIDSPRPLVQWQLEDNDWTSVMSWLRGQPKRLHVLADPGHALQHGTSVRVGGARDTVLEQMKDSAMAIYSRETAMRVAERAHALAGFADLSDEALLAAARRFSADVLIVPAGRLLELPAVYRTPSLVVYTLQRP